MNLYHTFFLMTPPAEGQEGSGWMSFLPLIAVVVVFYFFFIRPQMKKSKDQRKFREALKKGDKIITIGGVHGKVTEIKDNEVGIEVAPNIKITVEKSAIVQDSSQISAAK